MDLSRRNFVKLAASGLFVPASVLPTLGHAAPASTERKFLFIFCRGGWDPTRVFMPLFDVTGVDMEQDATTAEANGIPYVDRESRPSVAEFFQNWGDQAAVINGFEVRSVTHERCRQIMFTGSAEPGGDDWPVLLSAYSSQDLVLPHLVLAGPSFANDFPDMVVRVGDNGQLPDLLTGAALDYSDIEVTAPSTAIESLMDEFVAGRVSSLAASAGRGHNAAWLDGMSVSLDSMESVKAYQEWLSLDPGTGGCSRDLLADAQAAFDTFELGVTRCALVEDEGWCATGWDTHEANDEFQDIHFERLFEGLNDIMEDLQGRTAPSGNPLADELTIVLFSEMGRSPVANTIGGKDHWTFTSIMLIGAGVKGGQSIGSLDEYGAGVPLDLASGEAGSHGLTSADIGATLLALGDVDPGVARTKGEVVEAVLG